MLLVTLILQDKCGEEILIENPVSITCQEKKISPCHISARTWKRSLPRLAIKSSLPDTRLEEQHL